MKKGQVKIYKGVRTPLDTVVTVDGQPLPLRLDLRNHSPTGFEWGYLGSGPAQLALAILADAFGETFAVTHYHPFKDKVIARLATDRWSLALTDSDRQRMLDAYLEK